MELHFLIALRNKVCKKLPQYVNGNTKAYRQWENGDVGIAYLIFNEDKEKYSIDGFANHSAIKRDVDIRIKPVQSNESLDRTFSNFVNINYDSFNDKFYNDQLDMDQQNPEFWDGL